MTWPRGTMHLALADVELEGGDAARGVFTRPLGRGRVEGRVRDEQRREDLAGERALVGAEAVVDAVGEGATDVGQQRVLDLLALASTRARAPSRRAARSTGPGSVPASVFWAPVVRCRDRGAQGRLARQCRRARP